MVCLEKQNLGIMNRTQINISGEDGKSWNVMELLYYETIKKLCWNTVII
jgi:hypothetical protein